MIAAIRKGLGVLVLSLAWIASGHVSAQESSNELSVLRAQVSEQVEMAKASSAATPDTELIEQRNRLQALQNQARDLSQKLEPELANAQSKLDELTPHENIDTAPESEELTVQRQQLAQQVAELDAQLKSTRLLNVELRQSLDHITEQRRLVFRNELGRRAPSLLGSRLWHNLQRDWPQDQQRFQSLDSAARQLLEQRELGASIFTTAVLGGFLVVAFWLRKRFLQRLVSQQTPTEFQRAVAACVRLAFYSLIPGVSVALLCYALGWQQGQALYLEPLMNTLVGVAFLAGLIVGLGRVLLAPQYVAWRLLPLATDTSKRLGWFAPALAGLSVLVWVLPAFLNAINASLSLTLLLSTSTSLALSLLFFHLGRGVLKVSTTIAQENTTSSGLLEVRILHYIAHFLTYSQLFIILCLLLGYVAFSTLVVIELLWVGVIVSSSYVLWLLITDMAEFLLQRGQAATAAGTLSEAQLRTRSQFIVLLSAIIKIFLGVMAVFFLLSPFGEEPSDWLQHRLGFFSQGIHFGELNLKPSSLGLAFAVLIVGSYVVRWVRRWLSKQFLPTTRLDASMRSSTANLFSYVGYFLVLTMALSVLGLGLERMAWVLSALSVGVGFGLQAIVQNFVSGLILIAERPIKVGDWVSVNGMEGNVRRINARATEIEMFDRSSLIVPNSEFITKAVRNVTLSNPLGVLKLKILMPLNTDADRVREIMLAAMNLHAQVLPDPAPAVTLDGFDNNGLAFTGVCYVVSPRVVGAVRSALYFEVLRKFRAEDLSLHDYQKITVQNKT